MASTNAAGAHSMRFGSTRPRVRALDCVFADGSRATARRGAPPPREVPAVERLWRAVEGGDLDLSHTDRLEHPGVRKDSSGYAVTDFARSGELVDLLVGSEGTLVVIVGLELDLAPMAGATSSVLAAFASLEQAVHAATDARSAGAVACELLDRTFLDVAAQGGGARPLPQSTESALLAEVEGSDAAAAARAAAAVRDIFHGAGATEVHVALDAATEGALWDLRHAASPILARLDPNLKSMQFIEDGAVPPDRLPDYVRGIREILERHATRGVIFGHAGDSHVHVNPLVDVSHPEWRRRVQGILHDAVALTARLGGTLTGEHGDGRLRTPLMRHVWPREALDAFRVVKEIFDPAGILNPGVKVAAPGARALGDVKYDPSLPPLPAAARAALDRVERDRAYASFRLDLLDGA
jgi:FAD/FMN-containing dehydrogenase